MVLGIRYLKVAPTTHVLQYRGGKLARDGAGLSFFYFGPFSEIALIPLASTDSPFVFNEVTSDFQEIAVQGQLTYRTSDAKKLASVLDFSVQGQNRYRSDDPNKLSERLTNAAQILARSYIQKRSLKELLGDADGLVMHVQASLGQAPVVSQLGIEILEFHIVGLKATPEMSKALQAQAREELLKEADEAIFARRNAAVDMERTIRENELNTEILVENKKREVRETQLSADISIEEKRASLVDSKVSNDRKEAEAKAYTLQSTLEPLKQIDWRILMAIQGGGDAGQNIAVAFRQLAENASKIGELNISPELLASLNQRRES